MATKNSWNSDIPVEISKGGTNATTMATSTGIVKYDGTSLVTSSTAKIDSSNFYINSSQPRFSARLSATQSNVTGAGTYYSFVCDTEDYDIGSNYSTATGIFTAPVDGVYLLTASAYATGNPTVTEMVLKIIATSHTYTMLSGRASSSQNWTVRQTIMAYMSAGNTAYPSVAVSGGAGDTTDLFKGDQYETCFQGVLLT